MLQLLMWLLAALRARRGMSKVQGLDWQTWRMPFTGGLNQKVSPRMLEPPALTIAKDLQFDTLGDLLTRLPYGAAETNILGGGTISNARRIVEHGDEKLLFTKDTLYSWNALQSKWMSRGTHLAVKVGETPRFIRTTEQIECDRAELDNVIVYSWTDNGATPTAYVAAVDKTTGAVIQSPTSIGSGTRRTRLIAVGFNKIHLYFVSSGLDLKAISIDTTSVASTITSGIAGPITICTVGGSGFNLMYDAAFNSTTGSVNIACRLNPTTSYRILNVPLDPTFVTGITKARTCVGAIAVSVAPDGKVQIIRDVGANSLEGDLLSTAHTDLFTAQAIGTYATSCNQIACAHRSVTDGGFYRCYVFWSSDEQDRPTAGSEVKYNWVNTNNTLSAQATFLKNHGVASRAFDHEGRVYVNCVFAGNSEALPAVTYGQRAALQNTYFLLRDDAFLVAKSVVNSAGGYRSSTSHLPGVALTEGSTGYSWCGTERRVIQLGGLASGYADRGPRDVTYTFDSNEARRCARLGSTLYIACGEGVMQYDGVQLTEVGYHLFPYFFEATYGNLSGSIDNGTYSYKVTPRWDNAVGEIDRGTTATTGQVTIVGAPPGNVTFGDTSPISVTHKTQSAIAIEFWRTLVNPPDDAPYYLVTSKDPTDTSGANCYVANTTTSSDLADWVDELADADLENNETSPENGSQLENLAPPPATIIIANGDRLFLAGIAGAPYTVRYSKSRAEGEVASFHEALSVNVPPEGGPITGLAFVNETLVAFCESAAWALPGEGFDNTGGGQNYGPARVIPGRVGAMSQESIASYEGGTIFKSSKGWYRINGSWALEYIGGNIKSYDSETSLAVTAIEGQHQVRILTASRMLVLDTLGGQWFEWTISDGVHACMWQGSHVYLTSTGTKVQQSTYTLATYGMDVEVSWVNLAGMQAFGRVRLLEIIGEFRSACSVRVRLARNNWEDGVDAYFDDRTWTATPAVVGGPLELDHGPSEQQVNQLKVRLTVTPNSAGESVRLSAINFELGFKRGIFRRLPAAQTQ